MPEAATQTLKEMGSAQTSARSIDDARVDAPRDSETRVSDWVDTTVNPAWSDSDVAAYRIWQRRSPWGWEQSHEWRYRDGTERRDGWIRGAAGWTRTAKAA